MCGRYYIEDDTAKEIEKVIRWVDDRLHAQRTAQADGFGKKEGIGQEPGIQESKARTAKEAGQEAGTVQGRTTRNDDKESVRAEDGKTGDIYPAALAPVLGAATETAGCRALDCRMLRWGLPGYAPKEGGKKEPIIFNARSETVMEKPTFREGMKNHRIVIPAAGFYEWNKRKEKFRFCRKDAPVLFMAGCFQHYEDGDRFVILTTAANASMAPVHDRMPLILEPDEIAAWIWDAEQTKYLLERQSCLLERETDYEQLTLF